MPHQFRRKTECPKPRQRLNRPREGARHRIAQGERPSGREPWGWEGQIVRALEGRHIADKIHWRRNSCALPGRDAVGYHLPLVRALRALTRGYPMFRPAGAIEPLRGF